MRFTADTIAPTESAAEFQATRKAGDYRPERLVPSETVEIGTVLVFIGQPLVVAEIIPVETPDTMRGNGIVYIGKVRDLAGRGMMLIAGESVRVYV